MDNLGELLLSLHHKGHEDGAQVLTYTIYSRCLFSDGRDKTWALTMPSKHSATEWPPLGSLVCNL